MCGRLAMCDVWDVRCDVRWDVGWDVRWDVRWGVRREVGCEVERDLLLCWVKYQAREEGAMRECGV